MTEGYRKVLSVKVKSAQSLPIYSRIQTYTPIPLNLLSILLSIIILGKFHSPPLGFRLNTLSPC